MKTLNIQNRIFCLLLTMSAAAVLMLGFSTVISRGVSSQQTVISAQQPVQVADGSESNGGKGGKGGAKRTFNV